MKQKLFLQIISFLFAVKALFGAVYILLGWNITISNMVVPIWLVVVAVVVDAYLSYLACKLSKGKK